MRRVISYSLCCYGCGCCGCCERFYVLPPPPPPPPLLLLVLPSVCHGLLKVGLPEAENNHYEIKWVNR